MRVLLWIGFLLSTGFIRAAESPLKGGVSPDQAYEVTVADNGTAICYSLRSRLSGKLLLTIPSSYQRDGDAEFYPAFRKSSGARVVWNRDSSLVAVDEDVHRFIGELFLIHVARNHAVQLDLKKESIERAAHQPWDRVSIHQPEWTSARGLQVYLHGLLPAVPPAQPTHREFTVYLEIGRNDRVHIKSLQNIAKFGA